MPYNAQLIRDLMTLDKSATLPGDLCGSPGCTGLIGIYSLNRKEGKITRYLSCNLCGWKPAAKKIETIEGVSKQPCADVTKLTLQQIIPSLLGPCGSPGCSGHVRPRDGGYYKGLLRVRYLSCDICKWSPPHNRIVTRQRDGSLVCIDASQPQPQCKTPSCVTDLLVRCERRNCPGMLFIYCRSSCGHVKTWYLKCKACGRKPEKNRVLTKGDLLISIDAPLRTNRNRI